MERGKEKATYRLKSPRGSPDQKERADCAKPGSAHLSWHSQEGVETEVCDGLRSWAQERGRGLAGSPGRRSCLQTPEEDTGVSCRGCCDSAPALPLHSC